MCDCGWDTTTLRNGSSLTDNPKSSWCPWGSLRLYPGGFIISVKLIISYCGITAGLGEMKEKGLAPGLKAGEVPFFPAPNGAVSSSSGLSQPRTAMSLGQRGRWRGGCGRSSRGAHRILTFCGCHHVILSEGTECYWWPIQKKKKRNFYLK